MKQLLYLIAFITIGCKAQNSDRRNQGRMEAEVLKNMNDSKNWPLDYTSFPSAEKRSTISFSHYYEIGDCFGIISKDSCFGLLLYDIVKTSEDIEYKFLLQDHIYNSIPTINEFKQYNFWGRKISDLSIKKNIIGFYTNSVSEASVVELRKALIKISSVNLIDHENRFGGGGGWNQISDIAQTFNLHQSSRNGEFRDNQFNGRDTSFNFSILWISASNGEIKKPQYVWTLSIKEVHPNAKKLMPEDWWYDPGEDFAPFGNDDGSDALYTFKDWRDENPKAEPALFLISSNKIGEPILIKKIGLIMSKLKKVKRQIFSTQG